MEEREVETNKLIATRIKGKGDTWTLVDDPKKVVHSSLTDALEAYLELTGFKGEYRLAPLDSKLYAILNHQETIAPPPIRTYNIYGEEEQ